MPVLKEITKVSPDAAAALEKAGFVSDTDIRSLTRQDLYELIPGPQNIRLRKTICDIIQNVKPINAVLKELLDSIPDDYVKAALTKDGVLYDYLVILRDMKTKVESVNSFLKAHNIGLFEESDKKQQKPMPVQPSVRESSSSSEEEASGRDTRNTKEEAKTNGELRRHRGDSTHTAGGAEEEEESSGSVAAQSTVRVKVTVKGETFGCHLTLLQRVTQLGGLHIHETNSGPKVVIVFYPLKTRCMTDIEAAMKDVVPGGAAVILVVMHHTHDRNYPNIVTSLDSNRGWDFVNVFYHETKPGGLQPFPFNDQAVAQLHGALLKHSSVVSPVAATAAAALQYVLC